MTRGVPSATFWCCSCLLLSVSVAAGCTEDFDAPFAASGQSGATPDAGTGGAGGSGGAGGTAGAGGAAGVGGATGGAAGAGATGGLGGTGGTSSTGGTGATGGTGGATGGTGGATGGTGGATGGTGGATGGSAGVAGTGGATGGASGTSGTGGAAGGPTGRLFYSPSNSADLFMYDVATDAWSEKAYASHDIRALTGYGGFLYAKSTHANVGFYRYNPGTDSWTSLDFAPSGSSLPAHLVAGDGAVYYFANQRDLFRYDIGAGSWSTCEDMPLDRGQNDSFEYADGYIYHAPRSDSDVRRYDVSANTWSDVLNTFPSSTYGLHDLQDVNGVVYGVNGLAGADVYDPTTNSISDAWIAAAEVMAYDPALDVAYVYSGLSTNNGEEFRRCDMATQQTTVLAPPPGSIASQQFAYLP